MIYILLTIGLFGVLIVIFKLFNKYGVDNLQALIFNYVTAATLGYMTSPIKISGTYIVSADWLPYAVVVGALFIVVFDLYATGTQKVGIAITTVANKMSLVIPVAVALVIYPNSNFTIKTFIAFILALLGIYLSSTQNGKISFDKKYIWLIVFVFVGQGIADSVFNFAQQTAIEEGEAPAFFFVLFVVAALFGVGIVVLRSLKEQRFNFVLKNVLAGILLGIPNYGSLISFFKALEYSGFHPSKVFPIVSTGVVILSAVLGVVFYREKLSRSNWVGILCAVLAIVLIA